MLSLSLAFSELAAHAAPERETDLGTIRPIDNRYLAQPTVPAEPLWERTGVKSVHLNSSPSDFARLSLAVWVRYFGDLSGTLLLTPPDSILREEMMVVWSPHWVSPEAAWMGFLAALDQYGYTVTFTGTLGVIARTAEPLPCEAPRVEVFALEHSQASDLLPLLDTAGAELSTTPQGDALIVSGSEREVWKVHAQLEALDTP